MALTTKQRKKLTRTLTEHEQEIEDQKEKQNAILTNLVIQYFVLFCVILLFDQLVGKIFFPFIKFSEGIGFMQYLASGFCLWQMCSLARMIK